MGQLLRKPRSAHVRLRSFAGTIGNDTIDALAGDDTVNGLAGDDSLIGGAGNDILNGDQGNDTLLGGTGRDTLDGGDGNDSLNAGSNDDENDLIIASIGNDTIDFIDASDRSFYFLEYGNFSGINATLDFTTGNGNVVASSFTDTLLNIDRAVWGMAIAGTSAADTFTYTNTNSDQFVLFAGGRGNDTFNLTSSGGTTRLDFSFGYFEAATQGAVANLGTGVIANDGFGTTDTVNASISGNGRIELQGTDFADNFTGSDGNDRFITHQGNDTVDGGMGFDTIRYDRSGVDAVNVNLSTGTATGTWDGNGFTDTLSNIEAVRGSRQGDDTIIGSGADERFEGRGGNDSLVGGGGDDELRGEEGNDTIRGGDGRDWLRGGDGNDLLDASGGAASTQGFGDYIRAGLGQDTILGHAALWAQGEGADISYTDVSGVGGLTIISGFNGTGTVVSGDGRVNDTFTFIHYFQGSQGADSITGASGDRWEGFEGNAGNDTIDGGGGDAQVAYNNEHFDGGTNGIVTNLGTGDQASAIGTSTDTYGDTDTLIQIDQIRGSVFDDAISGSNRTDNLRLHGQEGNDSITGGAGDDELEGDEGNDTLIGGAGNDRLRDGDGNDSLLGGDGDDVWAAGSGEDTFNGGDGSDTIRLDLSDLTPRSFVVETNLVTGDSGAVGIPTLRDVLISVEGVELIGDFDIIVTGNGADNRFETDLGDDTLLGNAGDDTIISGGGDDSVSGGDDNDRLEGGDGNDTLEGGSGGDTLEGGAGNDVLGGGDGDDWFRGGAGNDTVILGNADWRDRLDYSDAAGAVSVDLVTGLAQDGEGGIDTILLSPDGDSSRARVIGSQFDDLITGTNLNDSFTGEGGDDTINGGGGFDFVWYGRAASAITVDLDSGNVSGGEGQDQLTSIEGIGGSNFSDNLLGSAADEYFVPDNDDDQFTPNYLVGGDDTINGFGGFDWVSYFNAAGAVNVNLQAGSATDGRGNTDTLLNIENIDGSDFSDILTGSIVRNEIQGGEGNDTIVGLAGDDTLTGGAGNDSLSGGADADSLRGGIGNDTLEGGSGLDDLFGEDGDDLMRLLSGTDGDNFDGGNGVDTVDFSGVNIDTIANLIAGFWNFNGSAPSYDLIDIENMITAGGSDTITGSNVDNVLISNGGNDTVDGRGGNDTIDTGQGDDRALGRVGDDSIRAGDGNDLVVGADGNDTLLGGSGDDRLIGAGGGNGTNVLNLDSINGGDGNDTLFGSDGNDTLLGGNDDDQIRGNGGDDSINGGAGTDRATYYFATSAVTVNLATGTASGGDGNDTLISIEDVDGSNGFGDLLRGNGANNRLNGLNANDTIFGGNGNDTVIGDDGNDVLYGAGGENGSNVVNADRLDGGTGRDFLYGSDGQDTLIGRDGDDFLVGNNGNDVINGGAGIDWVSYQFATGAVTASLATGSSAGADGIDSLIQIERLRGSAFDDLLVGNNGDNVLAGFDGNDTLEGRAGADRLQGDRGDDTLTGGADADVFVFGNNFGDDVITDFDTANAERIDLSANNNLNSFADVLGSLTNNGGFAQINDGVNSILLDGIAFGDVSLTGLVSAADFIFV